MKVICDSCNTTFHVGKLMQRMLDANLQETYYTCSNCRKEYRVCVTSKEIRDMQNSIKCKKALIGKTKNPTKRSKIIKDLNRLIDKHKKEMDSLNKRSN